MDVTTTFLFCSGNRFIYEDWASNFYTSATEKATFTATLVRLNTAKTRTSTQKLPVKDARLSTVLSPFQPELTWDLGAITTDVSVSGTTERSSREHFCQREPLRFA